MNQTKSSPDFSTQVHRLGRFTVLLALTGFIGFPILFAALTQTAIDWGIVMTASLAVLPTFTVTAVSENLAYCPMIGSGAVYIACVTGNISNMKLPACVNAMELADCEPGSEKGDVLSILAVCSSTITTTILMFLGMLFLAPLFEPVYNNPVLQPAFLNLIPAMMGALLIPHILRSAKDCIVPILIPVVCVLLLGPSVFSTYQSFIMIGVMILAVFASYKLHQKELKQVK